MLLSVMGLALVLLVATACSNRHDVLSHGRFRHVYVYKPKPDTATKHFALVLSGDGGWNPMLTAVATALAQEGTLVAGVDTAELFVSLEADGGKCVNPDGDLENLSHFVQAYYHLPTYFTPILIGHSAGATLAYATLAQAPKGLFAGALTLSFCEDLDLSKPLCQTQDLRGTPLANGRGMRLLPAPALPAPWIALHGSSDQVCSIAPDRQFVAQVPGARFVELPGVAHNYPGTTWMPQLKSAFATLAAAQTQQLPAPPADLAGLPIVEVDVPTAAAATTDGKTAGVTDGKTAGVTDGKTPAATGSNSDTFAIMISGDGGWAGIDKEVAAALAQRGVPTAGLDSLRYFWTARTPDGLAHDIDRMVRYYSTYWHRSHALLIGYSQGADVLPFVVNRLPPATRSMVRTTALIGISDSADFEFHVTSWLSSLNWFGHDEGALPTQPEIDRLSAADTLCVYGSGDKETICPSIAARHVRAFEMTGGHHFGGNYQPLAQLILDKARVDYR